MKRDITGRRFWRLVVVRKVGTHKGLTSIWLCRCDCGNEKETRRDLLTRGEAQSCGCLQKEQTSAYNCSRSPELAQRGPKKAHPLYATWLDMRRRCTKPWMHNYKYYGAKGVEVCEQWANDFWAFVDYIGQPPGDGYTVDRIDPYGNYEPGNIRWATYKEQANNQRRHKT